MEQGTPNKPLAANKKVNRACQRCRRQKLKCDIQRPCMLCVRAGASCVPNASGQWRVYQPQLDTESERPTKRTRTATPKFAGSDSRANQRLQTEIQDNNVDNIALDPSHQSAVRDDNQPWNSSSTMSLVDGAFQFHNATAPGTPVTNAIPGGQQREVHGDSSGEEVPAEETDRDTEDNPTAGTSTFIPSTIRSLNHSSRSAVSELVSLFPEYEAAALLVDTYFDRVHWFMLIFHQDEFRRRWQKLYTPSSQAPLKHHNIAFVSTFLMVIAIGLQYAGPHRQTLLARHNIDHEKLKEQIFSAIRAKLLDIVSLGSLEAVQTCVLLGTYYLFHGSPSLAWPVCGCGLRIAQALNLHRKLPKDESGTLRSINLRNQNETRKRCWWAIYEIETFCSMSYGYPHGIKDADCDVEPLDPSAKLQFTQSPTSFDQPLRGSTTLLAYKYFMSELSVLTKAALSELYGIGPASADQAASSGSTSSLHCLIQKVTDFDTKLREWNAKIPLKLQLKDGASDEISYASPEELDRDIGASGPRFESYIFKLQALALKLAYENARILVHRPLLSYRLVTKSTDQGNSRSFGPPDQHDPFRLSLQACRDAALSTSEIVSMPIAALVSDTYAAAFVGIHTFTAGITLGILSSIEPLSPQSHEAKTGLHRLMAIQTKLRDRSTLAAQGLEILQRLTRHVMEKELSAMLDVSKSTTSNPVIIGETPGRSNRNDAHPAPNRLQESISASPAIADQRASESNSRHASSMPPVEESVNTAAMTNDDLSLQYMEDPTLSQAIYDFDQAISTQTPHFQSTLEEASIEPSLFWPPSNDGFPALEQAWIWGLDNFAPPDRGTDFQSDH